ncbi:E3 ubiquitin-protein ligase rad18 [Sporothrix bragantina]|uniref:Postreplication repair E3 ubiquitin-protein ligase RAD18 n=1 Tax=Sporothrix bragantina TaxID=671064 RepID=A0ABP0BP39_9PEZI
MDLRDGDVADSTDWLDTTLACLMPVEQAFRCHVCKDFYNSPMITSCNHTFCSLCIRRCLSVDGKCPLCRMTDQESKLRGNWALREAIDAFCKARPTILKVARKPLPQESAPTAPAAVKRKADEAASQSPASANQPESQDEPQTKRTRSSARLSKTKAAEAVSNIAQDEMVVEVPDSDSNGDGGDTDYEPDDGLVACPICQRRMKIALINGHLDSACSSSPKRPKPTTSILSKTSSSATTSSSFNPFPAASAPAQPPERLPSVSYSLLNDSALRKKMAALGLATFGSRQLLERRHKEWTTIWNANCDSARPKRKAELLHDLDIWERTVGVTTGGGAGGGSGSISSSMMGGRGSTLTSRTIVAANQQAAQIKDKDFDGAAWSAKHNSSFQDLIANARKSRSKQQAKAAKDASDDSSANEKEDGQEQMPRKQLLEETPPRDGPQASEPRDVVTEEVTIVLPLGDVVNNENGAQVESHASGEAPEVSEPDSLAGDRAGIELQ